MYGLATNFGDTTVSRNTIDMMYWIATYHKCHQPHLFSVIDPQADNKLIWAVKTDTYIDSTFVNGSEIRLTFLPEYIMRHIEKHMTIS